MTDDLKRILAAIFRLGKGTTLSRTEMVNLMIYNLRWFDPKGAKKVIQAGSQSGLLKAGTDGQMSPTFDIGEIEHDMGWEPPKDLDLGRIVKPLMERLINAVEEAGMDRREAVKSINRASEELNLLFPAAAVHVGSEKGADMSMFYNEVENFLLYGDR
ncbi:MAG: DUF2240 family protein [Candidatus Thermoplasmatota archaeon]|nr:DUF2240 family protein [Candidatus Thermoplasmatota archaeon]